MRLKIVVTICLLIGFMGFLPAIQAQSPSKLVLVCVTPNNVEDGSPYVIVFRNSPLFGLVIPIPATVSVFSNQLASATVQRITPDATTGGYRLGLEVMRLWSDFKLLNQTDCAEEIAQVSQSLNISVDQNTLPMRVAQDYGLTIQLGGENMLSSPYLGVFGLQFTSAVDGSVTNFQVAQVSPDEPSIHISLSGVSPTASTTYLVIGNKLFDVKKSGATNPDIFSSPAVAEDFPYLEAQAKATIPALFNLMEAAHLPIYPGYVLGYINAQTFAGGYLALATDSAQALRSPEFAPEAKVAPLTDIIEARIYLPARPTEVFGKLAGTNTATVVRVDEQGQLIVRDQDGQEAIIEAWRVKASEITS